MIAFRALGSFDNLLGESPVWDSRREALFLCDTLNGTVYLVGLDGVVRDSWTFDRTVGSLGLTESGRLVLALGLEVVLFDPDSGVMSLLAGLPEPETNRLNDGKVGPDGCFYIGSMDNRPQREPVAALYRVGGDGSAAAIVSGVKVSNGLAWSPDGRRLYHSDSSGPFIDCYDFDATNGTLSNRRRFADLDEATGRPDGGACDAEGHYWSAGVSAGVLNRFSKDGAILSRYQTPVRAPTMPCFCGPGLGLLVVTSHRYNLPPGSGTINDGAVLIAEAPVPGTPVMRMKGL